MIFVTYWFLCFAGFFFLLYWVAPNGLARKLILLIGCAVFHTHFAGPAGVLPIICLGILTYFAGRFRFPWLCYSAIAVCIGALVFYKYAIFISEHVIGAIVANAGVTWKSQAQRLLPAAPPLAISFFAFEFVHYLYDIAHGQRSIKSPLEFALFSIFWPSIVSGPVKRYQQFLPSLECGVTKIAGAEIAEGTVRIGIGLAKKFVADSLTALISNHGIVEFSRDPFGVRWLIFLSIAFRILLDFSGYSDMAIGYARLMGVRLPENFNWPYIATNMAEFWQRWHISLSSWIRDYVYIPLGGNRLGPARRVFNGLIAFSLCGLWHGAGWNFIVWGVYHGAGVAVCSTYREWLGPAARPVSRVFGSPPVAWAATFLYVGFGWLLFFFPVSQALAMTRLLWRYH